ncbi:OmpA-like transmembrane domain [Collimonas arenae]|uniref:OmpA-like transmembrane domain n=1 Tax=Collimonas arenae TaxID=279058 RepID=A0A0A1FER0_9BURK|nr:carbohydrate porin [Collimonas arenae]AIY42255.1 OmpA-like transmembrane domain [Collimonas arenae]
MFQRKKTNPVFLSLFALCLCLAISPQARADDTGQAISVPQDQSSSEPWSVHGQATFVNQWHPSFTAPYGGANSLDSNGQNNETFDLSVMIGRRLWQGAELWINPEIDQGFGLSNTLGVAGYPSGEAYKVGANAPYLRLPRLFLRQVIGLDGPRQQLESALGQLAGSQPVNNVTLTVGKFSVVDIFDTNSYAHDPRSDFLNWSLIDGGSFDYAADPWGFTVGAAVEWNQDRWTLRGGVFQLSETPNAKMSGVHFRQRSFMTELEERHQWQGHPGKLKLLVFINQGDMASYQNALQLANLTGGVPDVSQVRRYSSNPGVVLNFEQELTSDLGVFARASANGGHKETYEFTEINRSVAAGLSLAGNRWGRPDDKVGVAGVVNALSSDARQYFAAGGTGLLIGDGQLNYAREKIAEIYYSMRLNSCLKLSADYQRVVNPAYNKDRGPVSFYALRLHAEY